MPAWTQLSAPGEYELAQRLRVHQATIQLQGLLGEDQGERCERRRPMAACAAVHPTLLRPKLGGSLGAGHLARCALLLLLLQQRRMQWLPCCKRLLRGQWILTGKATLACGACQQPAVCTWSGGCDGGLGC